MQIHLLGGIETTGASCLIVEAAGRRVLVDAGAKAGGDPSQLAARIQALGGFDAAVVTHAHMDHAGALPTVLAQFPRASLMATPATLALLGVFLTDPEMLAQRARRPAIPSKDDHARIQALLARGTPLSFRQRYPLLFAPSSIEQDWALTLFRAGHVLGSAMALLETPEGAVLVSGDISRMRQQTVNPARFPRKRAVDVFVLESTFGGRGYRPREVEEARMVGLMRSALDRSGHVLIACSALGIAQEILLILTAARKRKQIRDTIWVDGVIPAANAVYAKYAIQESVALARFIQEYGNPFAPQAGLVRVVTNQAEREALLAGPPVVLVSSSASLQTGPSAFYASQLAKEEEHLILLPIQEQRNGMIEK